MFSASTSADRRPDSSISPAIALSRQLRKLSSRAVAWSASSPFGSRRGCLTRSFDAGRGAARCPSSPPRSARPACRRAAPLGTGLGVSGSRIARNSNIPEIAAIRRLTVAAAYPVLRPSRIEYTFPPGRPRNVAVRQCDRYRSSVSAVTSAELRVLGRSQRQNASRSNA